MKDSLFDLVFNDFKQSLKDNEVDEQGEGGCACGCGGDAGCACDGGGISAGEGCSCCTSSAPPSPHGPCGGGTMPPPGKAGITTHALRALYMYPPYCAIPGVYKRKKKKKKSTKKK